MRLSPLDIRKQDFDTSLRGYSKEDVDAFLQMLSEQWEEVIDEQRRLEDEVRTLENKMEHYQQVEEALQEALQTARENSEQKLENAEQKARLIVETAESQADNIKREAREEREVLRRQVDQLQEQRDKAVAQLRAFLTSEMELLLRFDDGDVDELNDSLPDHLTRYFEEEETEATEEPMASHEPSSSEGAHSEAVGQGSPPPQEKTRVQEPAQGRETSAPAGSAPDEPSQGSEPEKQASGNQKRRTPSTFEMPVSKDLSGQTSSSSSSGDDQELQRAEAERTPPVSEGEETVSEEEPADELTDFLEQFEAEQPFEEGASEEEHSEMPASGRQSASSSGKSSRSSETAGPPQQSVRRGQGTPGEGGTFESGEGRQETVPENGTGEEMTATPDEIEKIRRILNDME